MAKISSCYVLATFAICSCIVFQKSFAKPAAAELQIGPDPVSSITTLSESESDQLQRDQRSPQYGFPDYGDYYDGGSRHYKHKHKPHKPIYVPVHGGHGCRGYRHGCGGYSHHRPSHGGGQSGSYASAGSFGSGNHGNTQSQAQSTSLSFGPFSISSSQAQSQSSNGGGGYGGNGGFGGFGFDY